MIAQLAEWIAWGAFALIKFAITPSAMIAADYSLLETWLVSSIGATVGLIAFYRFGPHIFAFFRRLFSSDKPRLVFTKKNRRIVHFKNTYGLWGLALASVLLSVPLTGILAGKYFKHDNRAVPVLLVAFWSWSLLLSYLSWRIRTA